MATGFDPSNRGMRVPTLVVAVAPPCISPNAADVKWVDPGNRSTFSKDRRTVKTSWLVGCREGCARDSGKLVCWGHGVSPRCVRRTEGALTGATNGGGGSVRRWACIRRYRHSQSGGSSVRRWASLRRCHGPSSTSPVCERVGLVLNRPTNSVGIALALCDHKAAVGLFTENAWSTRLRCDVSRESSACFTHPFRRE